eukprot:NODE_1455_length_597_cov_245.042194_g1442_i0.p2 GENE.NODE_1455_length_597_cov_245.042194_g1442_i0~~NODE_1455_length_597_cov_245.042194_g1442_i0.p2  ORF type:complete len:139 (-),score=37.36 NODE_1455_length_597_cov_245.042194_g1442_i0:116-532(-)
MYSAVSTQSTWGYELDGQEVMFTIFTDSMDMYQSRMVEEEAAHGPYTHEQAAVDFALHLQGLTLDHMQELGHWDKKTIHNLKYFTWVEQQQKEVEELNQQWFDYRTYFPKHWRMVAEYDRQIQEFNKATGLLEQYEGK